MRSWTHPILLFVLLLCTIDIATAKTDGYFTLINGTPYDWSLKKEQNHRMDGFKFPTLITAGTTSENYFRLHHHDSHGEATYTILGTANPHPFAIAARFHPKNHPQLEVKYLDTLSSLNSPPGSSIALPWYKGHATAFILAGSGTNSPYISTNPPVNWMQATLDNIGGKTLNEIALPLSHDAGLSKLTKLMGGVDHNTRTQTLNVYGQLLNGARSFDIRPLLTAHGRWLTGHTTKVGSIQCGGAGEYITDIVKDINKFTKQYPGELIILHLSHDIDLHGASSHRFNHKTWHQLYQILSLIDDLWRPAMKRDMIPYDMSRVPLTTFIQKGGRSAVLIKIPGGAPLPDPALDIGQTDVLHAALSPAIDVLKMSYPDFSFDYYYDPAVQPERSNEDSSRVVEDDDVTPANDGDHDPDTSDGAGDENAVGDTDTTEDTVPAIAKRLSRRTPRRNGLRSNPRNPFPAAAIIEADRLREHGSYSHTKKKEQVWHDQVNKLQDNRGARDRDIFRMIWTLTQDGLQATNVGVWKDSIIENSHHAKDKLYQHLWDACSKTTYPNLIEVDDVRDLGPLSLAMGINEVFARDYY